MDGVVGDGVGVDGVERKNVSLFVCIFVCSWIARMELSFSLLPQAAARPKRLCPACAFQPPCDLPHHSFINPASWPASSTSLAACFLSIIWIFASIGVSCTQYSLYEQMTPAYHTNANRACLKYGNA